jgi:ZIP family zinc transporter
MTTNIVAAVLLLSMLSFVTTVGGVALALWARSSDRAIAAGIGFSVGIMVLIALLELLPAANAEVGAASATLATLAGVAFIAVAHRLIPHRHLVTEGGKIDIAMVRSAYLVVLGLVLHDLPEGFAMANAYVAAPAAGVMTAMAIALHNLPEEFAMAAPVVATRRRRLLFGAALMSAAAEPVGAIVGLIAVGVSPRLNGVFLALAAGAMLFVSVHELIPMARRHRHGGYFLIGIAASALVYVLLAEVSTAMFGQAEP